MSIKKLSFEQIQIVVGALRTYDQEMEQIEMFNKLYQGHCLMSLSNIYVGALENCLTPISCGDNCLFTCMPERKPFACSYETWGILHDLYPNPILKCSTVMRNLTVVG